MQERVANGRGKFDSNYPIDLGVEHSNRVFKETFNMFDGKTTQEVLHHISKSQSETTLVLDNFANEFDQPTYVGHRQVNADKTLKT